MINDEDGSRLKVDGEDFMVFGMNWGYMPIGQNYTYDFWGKSDEMIKTALEKEMSLLRNMGVNVIASTRASRRGGWNTSTTNTASGP